MADKPKYNAYQVSRLMKELQRKKNSASEKNIRRLSNPRRTGKFEDVSFRDALIEAIVRASF